MGKINYEEIYNKNRDDWKELTNHPQKYEALLAGHYSDSNHFVYELLQNAEDAKATKTVIEYYKDKLVFYHNGNPFNTADVRGVSSMLMGTKAKEDAQTIGRFGMGFKSVFKYTYQPEIYSDDEAFLIKNYLLPIEIDNGWSYVNEKNRISYGSGKKRPVHPFSASRHLTKIVIPFLKKNNNGDIERAQGQDVLLKLYELTGEILLFLTSIKSLCWIDKTTGDGAEISLKTDKNDRNIIGCSIRNLNEQKESVTYYLKFKTIFNHSEMQSAEVSVAYKLNNRKNNINEMDGTDICVYFPTKDGTDLPFLIHGSFETAVSRERLMYPSKFNDYLFDILGDLIADSMDNLKHRNLITQTFIRRILLVAFNDEKENGTIKGLRKKVTKKFLEGELMPGTDGRYHKCDDLMIPAPLGIAEFSDKPFFAKSLSDKCFAVFNDIKTINFSEYYSWLRYSLDVGVYTLFDWARDLADVPKDTSFEAKAFEEFYEFLNEYKDKASDFAFISDKSSYESAVTICMGDAWNVLRHARVIINSRNKLAAAYKGDKEIIYLGSSSGYKRVSAIIHPEIAGKYYDLFKTGFGINEFDDFQYVKEKVIKKYIDVDESINFENADDCESEYIEDVKQIIRLMENPALSDEIAQLLVNAYIIKENTTENTTDNEYSFVCPSDSYADMSDEGVDLRIYFDPGANEDTDRYDSGMYHADTGFFERHGITADKLKKLGVCTSLVRDGNRSGKKGNTTWNAEGEYYPELEVYGVENVLHFINDYPESEISKKKSAELLKLLLAHSHKLSGIVKY